MKKPFLLLRSVGDYFKLAFCLILCIYVLYNILTPERSVAVFSQGDNGGINSFYGLLGSYI
ncbi:MAG: hypothetical protein E7586_06275 [Ruminococcaceae bacterium]|nr:hypothetical protein [Oscillospiraceae bacterium]